MKDLFDLTGKVALVTGASSGLGVQFAKALARQGADVAICARRVEKLEEVKKEVEALGVRCYAHACDVLKVEDIKKTVKDVADYFGKIDILVNNAGVGDTAPAESMTDEVWNLSLIHISTERRVLGEAIKKSQSDEVFAIAAPAGAHLLHYLSICTHVRRHHRL